MLRIVLLREVGKLLSKAESKKFFVIFFICSLALPIFFNLPPVQAVSTDIAKVQGPITALVESGSTTITLEQTPTIGNTLTLVVVSNHNKPTATQIGVDWTMHVSANDGAGDIIAIFTGSVTGPIISNQITINAAIYIRYVLNEYSGIVAVNPVDKIAETNSLSGATASTGITEALSQPNQLAIGGVIARNASSDLAFTDPSNDYSLVNYPVLSSPLYTVLGALEKIIYASTPTECTVTITPSSISAGAIITLKGQEASYEYTFNGVYDENTGEYIGGCDVTANFDDGTAPYSFFVNGTSVVYSPDSQPLYFEYAIQSLANTTDTTITRQYWLEPDEVSSVVYVWRGDATVTPYTISFLDYTGVLKTYPYVTINAYINGSLFPVEKRKVDMQNNVVFGLVPNRLYHISVGTSDNLLVYGDVLAPSYSTTLQLVVKGADFPKESLLLYPYVSFSVTRDFSSPFGSIIVNYNDSKKATEYFSLRITDDVGVTYYTYSANTRHAFVLNWTRADNQTVYYVTVDVVHSDYGSLQFKQVLANEANAVVLFDLTFLGSWGFNITFLIPIFVLLIIFGSFSYLNAEVGAVLGVLFAIIFTFIGWIPILPGALVTGLFFAVLMALVHNRRRAIGY